MRAAQPGRWRSTALSVAVFVALSGCVVKRGAYDLPEVPLPDEYRNASPEDGAMSSTLSKERKPVALSDIGQDAAMIEWWRTFGSRELAGLIDRGLANNPDMRIAALHIAQAKARLEIAKAGAAPTVQAPLTAANQAPGGAVGTVPAEGGNGGTQKSYQASIRGVWRPDLWGEQAATAESANFQLWQAVYDRDNVQRNVVASLASAYVEYLSLNDRLRIARETEKVLVDTLNTIEKRVDAQDATVMELEQQRAAIFSVRATIPNLEQQREDAINSIAFLVGTVPGSLTLSDQGLDSLTSPFVLPGLPSALLLRRPDVRMMEARLLAAEADVDAARARALPPIDLSAQAGYSSLFLGRLFQPQTLFWNLLGSISISLFDRGKRSSETELSRSLQEEMVEGYVRTVYQAMREVESALSTIRTSEKRMNAQTEAMESAKRAWDISTEVYTAGAADFLTMLDSERTYHRVLDEYQRVRMEQYRGYISLFQALGGGVKPGPALPGRGMRPIPTRGVATTGAAAPASKGVSNEGLDWSASSSSGEGASWQIEDFWQVELAGLYPRTTIGAAWRDLRARYPKLMENRVLRPSLVGQIEEGGDPQVSWYRLSVAKFTSVAAAHEFCGELMANQQRCRVISSRSDDTVPPPPGYVRPRSVVAAKAENLAAPVAPKPADSAPTPAAQDQPKPEAPVVTPETSPPNPTVPVAETSSAEKAKPAKTAEKAGAKPNTRVVEVVRKGRKGVPVVEKPAAPKSVEQVAEKAPEKAADQPQDASVAKAAEPPKDKAPAAEEKPKVAETTKVADKPKASEKPADPVAAKAARKPEEAPAFAVQLGAFANQENAEKGFALWQFKGYDAYVVEYKGVGDRTWYSVRTGAFVKRRDALELASAVMRKEDLNVTVVPYLSSTSKTFAPASQEKVETPAPAASASAPAPVMPAPTPAPEAVASPAPAPVAAAQTESPAAPAQPQPAPASKKAAKASMPATTAKPAFAVQFGAYSAIGSAGDVRALWDGKGYDVYVCEIKDSEGRTLYAVRSGNFPARKDAQALSQKLQRVEGAKAIVVSALLDAQGKLLTVTPPPNSVTSSEN